MANSNQKNTLNGSGLALALARGFSVLELLVAVSISGFLMLAMAGIMASSKKNYDVTDATSSIQENARFAMNSIARDLRMAGFLGCSRGAAAALGVEPVSGPAAPPNFSAGDSDELTITLSDTANDVTRSNGPLEEGANSVVLDPAYLLAYPIDVGQQLLVSDCGGAEEMEVTTADTASLTYGIGQVSDPSQGLTRNFPNGATITTLSQRRYFVGKRDQDDGTDSSLPVLFVEDVASGTTEELAAGVEFMRVLYGVDDYNGASDNDSLPEQYVSWEDYQLNGGEVVGLHVGLLVRSVSDAIVNDGGDVSGNYRSAEYKSSAFTVLDIDAAADLNLDTTGSTRKVFSNAFTIRNPMTSEGKY